MPSKDPRADDVLVGTIPTAASPPSDEFIVASHDVLFGEFEIARCDACSAVLAPCDDDVGYGIAGYGVYLGRCAGEPKLIRVPLCASCSSAIGMTALGRWEIEEEEG